MAAQCSADLIEIGLIDREKQALLMESSLHLAMIMDMIACRLHALQFRPEGTTKIDRSLASSLHGHVSKR